MAALLLVFLVPILWIRSTAAVWLLGVAVLGVALFLSTTNLPQAQTILAGMVAWVSLVCVFVLGQAAAGNNGGMCLLLLWIILLWLLVLRWRVRVQPGHILLINKLFSDSVLPLEQGLHLVPFIHQKLALLPTHDMCQSILQQVPTRTLATIEHVSATVRYAVEDPLLVFNELSASEPIDAGQGGEDERAADMLKQRWAEPLCQRVKQELDLSVADVISRVDEPAMVVHARAALQQQIAEQVHHAVAPWGLHVQGVRLLVKLVPDHMPPSEHEAPLAKMGETMPHPVPAILTTLLPVEHPAVEGPGNLATADTSPQSTATSRFQAEEVEQIVETVLARLRAQGETANKDEVYRMVQQVLEEKSMPSASNADDALLGLSN
jgi:hypothetical protein